MISPGPECDCIHCILLRDVEGPSTNAPIARMSSKASADPQLVLAGYSAVHGAAI